MTSSTIECPKCATPSPDAAVECPRCGIVFAKLEEPPAAAGPSAVPIAERLRQVVSDPLRSVTRLAQGVVLVCLAVWTWQFARAPMGVGAMESMLHVPDLVFHEPTADR